MSYWKRVQKIIDQAEVVLEVVDARFPAETRNQRVEALVSGKGKKLVLVLNKADLVSGKTMRETRKAIGKEILSVFVSGTKRTGITKLREAIGKALGKKEGRIAVVGYPNTGKSSIINALTGKKIRTSITAGFTKGEQLVGLKKGVQLIDSPGVIPLEEKNEEALALIGAKDVNKVKDIQAVGEKIIQLFLEKNPAELKKEFGVNVKGMGAEEVLKEIALKKGKLLKGRKADINAVSKMIALRWQKGKLRV